MFNEWKKFKKGKWNESIDVEDFILNNYKYYDKDESFLEDITPKTKKVWDKCKELLTEEFVTTNFDYNRCLALLYDLYLRGVCYSEGLDSDQIYSLKKVTTIKERHDAPTVQVESTNTYSEYRKNFRSMK